MAFFSRRISLAYWELAPVKTAMLALGILLGVYFGKYWKPLLPLVWVVFLLTEGFSSLIAVRATRKDRPPSAGDLTSRQGVADPPLGQL